MDLWAAISRVDGQSMEADDAYGLPLPGHHPVVRGLALAAIVAAPWLVEYATHGWGWGTLLDTLLIVYFLAAARRLPLRHAAAQPQRCLATFGPPFVVLLFRSKWRDNEDLLSLFLPPLIILLLLGGFILKLATRPRGAEVDWEPLITLALLLFGAVVAPPQGAAPADEKVKAAYKACLNAAKECGDTYKKCSDAFEACAANAWR